MNLFNFFINIFFISMFLTSCANIVESETSESLNGEWLIPKDQIYDGGPGKDGIPALANPNFITLSEADYLSNNNLVLVYKQDNEVRAYPHPILNWHEIINDNIDATKLTVSFCPLTGSGMGYAGKVISNGTDQNTTFGVSGLLYNNNLILYDRLTDSNWSQMKIQSVNGQLIGQEPEFIHVIETEVNTLNKLYPGAKVVSSSTGVYSSSQYNSYPYRDYRTNNDKLIFPISIDDRRLPRKERVLGVIGKTSNKVYQFNNFRKGIKVINETLGSDPIVVAGNEDLNFIVAYKRLDESGQIINFEAVQDSLPVIMKDTAGNFYDIFGEVINGPALGFKLSVTKSFIAYWFSFGAFYPGIEIY